MLSTELCGKQFEGGERCESFMHLYQPTRRGHSCLAIDEQATRSCNRIRGNGWAFIATETTASIISIAKQLPGRPFRLQQAAMLIISGSFLFEPRRRYCYTDTCSGPAMSWPATSL
jgi:hypothetical protein